MTYRYTLSYDDFKTAQKVFWHRTLRSRLRFYFWNWLMPASGIVATLLLVRDAVFHHFSYRPTVGGLLFGVAWIGLYMLVCRPIQMRRSYKRMQRGQPGDCTYEVAIDGPELISRRPEFSESRFRRKAVMGFIDDGDVALVLLTKKIFLPLPKHALPDKFFQELTIWLEAFDGDHVSC